VLRPAITSLEPIRSLTHPKAYFAITRGGTRTEITTKQNNGTGEKSILQLKKQKSGQAAQRENGWRSVYAPCIECSMTKPRLNAPRIVPRSGQRVAVSGMISV
jgi:hypothetical protein